MKIPAALGAALLIAAPSAGAQQPQKGTSAIIGIAIDSLHRRPLSGAEVMVAGANRTVITDSLGRFRMDSLPAGQYQVGLFHPLLDSLGISLASPKFSVGVDSTSVVRLAVPSAATLVAQTCKSRMRKLGSSAIFGRLMDPDTFEPVPNAEVSIVWVQYDASVEAGIHQTPRLVRDSTDSNGVFRLCGLPPELDARLQANYRGVMTADVPIQTSPADGDFIIRPLFVSRTDTVGTRAGKASVSGKVTFAGGGPATGSHVEVIGSNAAAVTNDKGEFSLSGAPSGTQMLLVRHLGWTPREIPVDLSAAKPQRVAVQLQKYIPVMDPIVVKARAANALQSVGFTQRQQSGMGRYITADEIARRQPTYLSDVLRTVPGLTVQMNGTQPEIVSTRGGGLTNQGCVNYFIDGLRFQSVGGDANEFVNPREVVGIEVYQPSLVPPEFMDTGGAACTTIVVWTKMRVR
ncbi:MAG: carboxypeptidase regulatory-like domain-containing protein [Gemmatimonadota bacterium]|nr:carboxypeptidase regulatory-like domain-containing protein [Gemmatimonadota bacterium]